jgi:hypothetical protein
MQAPPRSVTGLCWVRVTHWDGVDQMKIRLRYVLPAILLLAGCATTGGSGYSASNTAAPVVAPPQRVDAVSDAVGAKIDAMMANGSATSNGATR